MDTREHWETVYRRKRPHEVSWYAPHLETSLQLISDAAPNLDASTIDVGGGESTLVGDLLARGYRDISLLDVSSTALAVAKTRLGEQAVADNWLCGDVGTFAFIVVTTCGMTVPCSTS